jgi:hypothetical protein
VGFWKDVVFLYLFCFSSPFLSLAEGDIIVTGKKGIFMSSISSFGLNRVQVILVEVVYAENFSLFFLFFFIL